MVWRIFLFRVRLRMYHSLVAFAMLYSAVEGRLGADPLHCELMACPALCISRGRLCTPGAQGMLLSGAWCLAFSLASRYHSLIFSIKWERKPTDLHCNGLRVSLDISCCEERQTMTKDLLCLKKKALSVFLEI